MDCPRCHQASYQPNKACPACGFQGDLQLILTLDRVRWLLNELTSWPELELPTADVEKAAAHYRAWRDQLEVALALRRPPLTAEEAATAWPNLIQNEILLARLNDWIEAELVDPVTAQPLIEQVQERIKALTEQLADFPRPNYPQQPVDQLALVEFIQAFVWTLSYIASFTTLAAETTVKADLQAEHERLEILLGRRPAPVPEPTVESEPVVSSAEPEHVSIEAPAEETPALVTVLSPPPPAAPTTPLTERLWRSLLSERTLQAILTLGIFLLFSAAISFVIWGWRDFSAPVRVAIPAGFTLLFFGLGRYVRQQSNLYRSGLALSAIAALLVPIDFYTIYINFHVPETYAALFWFVTSLICLGAYILATLLIQSRFFGYLVAVAAGSAVLAAVQLLNDAGWLAADWRWGGLALVATGLLVSATRFDQQTKAPEAIDWQHAFAEPFRYLALLTFGVLLPLLFVWRFLDRPTYDALHGSLTMTWWLGGFAFGWGALHYRSRSLGFLSAFSLPVAVYLAQAAVFAWGGVNPAWHAFGLAWLAPLYLVVARRLSERDDDPLYQTHGRIALLTGWLLIAAAALWSLTDLSSGAAAAASHGVLVATALLAVRLWRAPLPLYAASFFALTSLTFTLTELGLSLNQLTPGWITLSLAHIFIVLRLGRDKSSAKEPFLIPIITAGYGIAALAALPAFIPYQSSTLTYALGNWTALAGWGAWLAYQRQPGFLPTVRGYRPVYHWATVLPLPMWVGLLFINAEAPNWTFSSAMIALAWGMVALNHWLKRLPDEQGEHWAWYLTGMLVSVTAVVTASFLSSSNWLPGIILILAGLLYLADAFASRYTWLLPIGSLVVWGGAGLWLNALPLPYEIGTFVLTLVVSSYYGLGLWLERRRSTVYPVQFVKPLYYMAHFLALINLGRIYFQFPWTTSTELWGAASQMLLALVYAGYAWARYGERWGHLATWLLAGGSGFVALAVADGEGLAAVGAAGLAATYVLTERGLRWGWRFSSGSLDHRSRARLRLIWDLYRRPLLLTGWTASAGAIGIALVRNMVMLNAAPSPRLWAWFSLLLVTGLYALSARLFRQRRFVWLASGLIIAPWTILTSVGWYTPFRPTGPGYAVSWVVMAWLLYLISLSLYRWGGTKPNYAGPAGIMTQIWLAFALIWGIADPATSRFTVGLGIGLYLLAAILDQRANRGVTDPIAILRHSKFQYPAFILTPLWAVYLLASFAPSARHEHYGLLLLGFGSLALLAGEWLRRLGPDRRAGIYHSLPGYLTAYLALIVGTMLVAHLPGLLVLVLLFDCLLLIITAQRFDNPLWIYPAAILTPLALLIALSERGIEANRHGWWLIGLAAIYLALGWTFRRLRLPGYSSPVLAVGLAVIALGLPPSSRDQIGALVGYGSAALLFGLTAFWLRQPLLLLPTCALFVVPYAVILQRSGLAPQYDGLALYPGAVMALAVGWWLDRRLGSWRDFPWLQPELWLTALGERLLNWWSLSPYLLGFGLTIASVFFTNGSGWLAALNLALMMPVFGWAIYRFRQRGWLLAVGTAGHLAAIVWLTAERWWSHPSELWLRFLPVTIITLGSAIAIERWRQEHPPVKLGEFWRGWSRPLYLLAALDLIVVQLLSVSNTPAGAIITLTHALLIGGLASLWLIGKLPYVSTFLIFVALMQWLTGMDSANGKGLPVILALLALLYGLSSYLLAWLQRRRATSRSLPPALSLWQVPLDWSGLAMSGITLLFTVISGLDLINWSLRAMIGLPFRELVDPETVLMVVRVLSILGLLYLGAAYQHRRLRPAYGAIGLLLLAWLIYLFYVRQWAGLRAAQWYALPAGLYLLTIAYLEWQRGQRALSRSIDYAATFLMLGSLFLQTWLFGWWFFLLLMAEGLLAMWYGSARRLRRFLYTGMVGVVLATLGQLLNALRSVNQWLVFGLIGLLLVVAAIAVERKLEDLKAWQDSLEAWE